MSSDEEDMTIAGDDEWLQEFLAQRAAGKPAALPTPASPSAPPQNDLTVAADDPEILEFLAARRANRQDLPGSVEARDEVTLAAPGVSQEGAVAPSLDLPSGPLPSHARKHLPPQSSPNLDRPVASESATPPPPSRSKQGGTWQAPTRLAAAPQAEVELQLPKAKESILTSRLVAVAVGALILLGVVFWLFLAGGGDQPNPQPGEVPATTDVPIEGGGGS